MDRYQQLLALSGECVKELDLNGSVTAVNANGLVLWQARDPSDVIGRAWTALWPGSAQVVVENAIARALRGERTDFEAACPDFAGEPRQWRVRVCPLFEQDRMVGVLAVSTDVTARNRAVWAAEVLQASSPLRAGMTGPASAIAPGGDAGRERTQASTESQLLASTAAYRQLEAMHEEAAVGHRFALAAQQAAELIATQAQKGEAVGQLLAGVVHDLNNSLQAAVSALDLVLAGKELGAKGLGYMRIAEKSLQQGTDMCQRLLGFAREYPYRPEAVDLSELVNGMTPLLAQAVGAKARLVVEADDSACCARVDRNTIERALLNLVINARDACGPDDSVMVTTGHRSVSREDATLSRVAGDYLTLTVADTGMGMGEDVLAHVFDVYFTTKPLGEGSGLGLPQVHSAVTQAGGFVTVTSVVGQGACFELALPRVDAAATR